MSRKIIARWHGGVNYAPAWWQDHAEYFETVEDMRDELVNRFKDNHFKTITPITWGEAGPIVGEPKDQPATPGVDETSCFDWTYFVPGEDNSELLDSLNDGMYDVLEFEEV